MLQFWTAPDTGTAPASRAHEYLRNLTGFAFPTNSTPASEPLCQRNRQSKSKASLTTIRPNAAGKPTAAPSRNLAPPLLMSRMVTSMEPVIPSYVILPVFKTRCRGEARFSRSPLKILLPTVHHATKRHGHRDQEQPPQPANDERPLGGPKRDR